MVTHNLRQKNDDFKLFGYKTLQGIVSQQALHKDHSVVLCLHGFMGSSNDFKPLILGLSEKIRSSYRFIMLDLPFHGLHNQLETVLLETNCCQSSYQQLFNEFIHVIIELIEDLGVENIILFGYSMGGRLALEAIKQGQLQVKGLFLESVSLATHNTEERDQRWKSDCQLFSGKENMEDFLREWYHKPLFAGISKHPQFKNLISKRKNQSVFFMQEAIKMLSVAHQDDLRSAFSLVSKNVYYVYGQNDIIYGKFAEQLPDSIHIKVFKVQDCSHMVHFQRLDFFTQIFEVFLLNL